ncbi:cell division protein ZipA [Marinobacter sp. X15-166B]|uniref:cell division protein ZipA n=1 Tax=Marinobacter sp. X15-166B TaxID=1897620 RepID=UPI00085CDD3C|nr:cell division protein ZipA [Marinobacter sp. X15-166B]OEY67409.1 cell division protein ZipA [Marinobacter sp. X15-166B]
MSLREWLIAIGTLIILVIVIDGIRRMRRARKESMAISSGMGVNELDESPLDEHYNPELPNGGARPISREALEDRGYVRKARRTGLGRTPQKPTRPVIDTPPRTEEPDWSEDDVVVDEGEPGLGDAFEEPHGYEELHESAEDPGTLSAWDDQPDPHGAGSGEDSADTFSATEPTLAGVAENTASRGETVRDASQPLPGANRPPAQEVVVINVLAANDPAFKGQTLKELFEACGLEYGDMDIYHRHEQPDTNSPVQFSVANMVEPGTFRPQDLAEMNTPGISFFMSLPGPTNSMQAFDFMLETAQCVVRNLGGELKDEHRSVMTPQTIEHCRQRIREYERKKRSSRA